MLIDGRWCDEDRTIRDGAYVRPTSTFDAPIPQDVVRCIAEQPGRFHLIASFSCPWSHRVMLSRVLKGLEAVLPLHIAGGPRKEGYRLGTADHAWPVPGTEHRIQHLHELYALAAPGLTARATVPVLWDAAARRIVSNESGRILSAFDAVVLADSRRTDWTLAPEPCQSEITALSATIQSGLSNAVYRAGKARRQNTYEAAVDEVFTTLSALDDRLAGVRYLHGPALTETDLRLWPTLVRFDLVYHGHFKCARRRLTDHPNLWDYTRDLLRWPGVAATFRPGAIRHAYYAEDRDLNPTGVVAIAPDLDWDAPHNRDRLGERQIWRRDGDCVSLELLSQAKQFSGPNDAPKSPDAAS